MMDIEGLLVWTLGSLIRVIQLIWKLKKWFVTWIMTYWILSDDKILTVTQITWIALPILPEILCQWDFRGNGSSKCICWSISRITGINGSMIHFFKQIFPNKCQAYRMKFLTLTLSFFNVDIILKYQI